MTGEMSGFAQHVLAEVGRFEPLLLHYGLVIIIAAVAVEGFGIPAPVVMSTNSQCFIYYMLVVKGQLFLFFRRKNNTRRRTAPDNM